MYVCMHTHVHLVVCCLCVQDHMHVCFCMCVCVCESVTWGHVSAFRLHLLSPPLLLLLLLFFFFVGEERSVAPVRAASIHRLSLTFSPLPSLLCLSLSLYPFFLLLLLPPLPLLLLLPLFTLSAPSQRAEDASLGVLSSH